MKIPFKDLLRIYPSLSKVALSTNLRPKTIYGAARAIDKIESEFALFDKKRNAWYKEMGERIQIIDPKDKTKMIDHPRGDMRIKPEFKDKFENLKLEFEEAEIEVYDFKIYLSDLVDNPALKDEKDEKKRFSVADVANMLRWIIDDLPQDDKEKIPLTILNRESADSVNAKSKD